jgi:hypothetical protein
MGSGIDGGPMPNRRDDGGLELVRVASRRRVAPGIVVAVLAVAVMAVGLWKPWVASGGTGASALPGTTLAPSSASPSAVAESPVSTDPEAARPATFGLDLSWMGTGVDWRAWGIATAYVPLAQIAAAVGVDRPWVTPVIDWRASLPDRARPGPLIAHDPSTTVALAVTWPVDLAPRSVELDYYGRTSGSLANPPPRASTVMPLESALASLVAPIPPEWRAPGVYTAPAWDRSSGTFFLPPGPVATTPAAWRTAGWPPGAYAFRIVDPDGPVIRLAFVLGG